MKAALVLALCALLAGCGSKEPSRDPVLFGTDGTVLIFSDPDTGCHYLTLNGKAITPRLTEDGKILCVR